MKTKVVNIALDGYGSFPGAEKGCLVVKDREGKVTKYSLSENLISEIELRSGNQVSVGALVTAAYWGIDLTASTSMGHPISLLRPLTHVETGVNQFDIWKSHKGVAVAKQFVLAKLKGCSKVLIDRSLRKRHGCCFSVKFYPSLSCLRHHIPTIYPSTYTVTQRRALSEPICEV